MNIRTKRSTKTDRCGGMCGQRHQTAESLERATRGSVHRSVSTIPTYNNYNQMQSETAYFAPGAAT